VVESGCHANPERSIGNDAAAVSFVEVASSKSLVVPSMKQSSHRGRASVTDQMSKLLPIGLLLLM
jgi:hypothetical protein